ncbi:MAG: hypothetical protein RL458_2538, partial [Pseudomonadota bacterium]
MQAGLQFSQQGKQRSLLGCAEIGQQRDHPGLMGAGHLCKARLTIRGEPQANRPSVSRHSL